MKGSPQANAIAIGIAIIVIFVIAKVVMWAMGGGGDITITNPIHTTRPTTASVPYHGYEMENPDAPSSGQ